MDTNGIQNLSRECFDWWTMIGRCDQVGLPYSILAFSQKALSHIKVVAQREAQAGSHSVEKWLASPYVSHTLCLLHYVYYKPKI